MSLVMDPIVRGWACRRTTDCCRAWRVRIEEPLHERILARLRGAGDPLAACFEHQVVARAEDAWAVIPQRDGVCVLLEDGLCAIRARLGERRSPLDCDSFPYISLRTPERHLVGLSFRCPTALALLAAQPQLEVLETVGEEPPTPHVNDLRNPEPHRLLDGGPTDAAGFWASTWEWLERFRESSGAPSDRLRRLIEQVAPGAELPALDIPEELWAADALEGRLALGLMSVGANPYVVAGLWTPSQATPEPLTGLPPDPEEGALLGRYLEHRLLVPSFLRMPGDQADLLATLCAMVARHRVERARGVTPLRAIRRLDGLFVHASQDLAATPDLRADWRSFALLALAPQQRPT